MQLPSKYQDYRCVPQCLAFYNAGVLIPSFLHAMKTTPTELQLKALTFLLAPTKMTLNRRNLSSNSFADKLLQYLV